MNVKEKMLKIFELALDINDPVIDDIGKIKTAIFVEWSPHCNRLSVHIHEGGWKPGLDWEELDCYTDEEDSAENLDAIIERLEQIKEGERNV